MLSRLSDAKGDVNKNEVYLINKSLAKIKKVVRKVPENKRFKTEENEKIVDIVERILEINSENQ